jgi:hypothetical protein
VPIDISEKNFEATIEQALLARPAAPEKGADGDGSVPGG